MSSSPPPTADAIRTTLSARCGNDWPPGAWRAAATAAGVSGADAFLCSLSRSIAAALESLADYAEAARVRLQSARQAIPDDCSSHIEDLEARIEYAATSKRAALEREACAVDAVLELLRAERSAATGAVASVSDSELLAMHAELSARLDAAEAQLLALPTAVVESPIVVLVVDEHALQADLSVAARVITPRAVTAAHLTVDGAPSFARPGCTLAFHLVLQSTTHEDQSVEELAVSLGAAAAAVHVEVALEAQGAVPQPLQADASARTAGRRVSISIAVPVDAPVGSSIRFVPLTVFGQPLAGLFGTLRVEVGG